MSEDLLLNSKECAAMLGMSRHRWARWVAKGDVPPPVNPGHRNRMWSRAALLHWIISRKNTCQPPRS